MPPLTRRQLLQSGSVGLGAGLAGCGAAPSPFDPSEAEIGGVAVLNYRDREHTVIARLRSEGETVFRQSLTVPGYDAAADDAGDGAFSGLPDEPAPYVLEVRLDSQGREEWTVFDTTEHDAPCHTFIVELGSPRRSGTGSDVTIWYGANPQRCEAD